MRLTPPRISSQRKRFWTALRWIVGKSSTPRRSNRFAHRLGFVVEALENRLFLSATDTLLSSVISALPPSTVQVGGDGSLYFRLGNQADAGVFRGQGGVALEGGGTDVDQAFQWMIGRMGGKGDLLVLRADNSDGYNSYIYDFGGVNSVSTLVVPNRAAAFDPFITQAILNADAVFIAGGSQNLYLDYWKGTPVQSALTANIARGTPVGGTSAGTDILGQFIYSADYNSIRSAAALTDPFDPSMTFDRNFVAPGLIPSLSNTILDTHFQNRDREGRMVSFLGRVDGMGWSVNNRPMGIGIDQETALLIAPNGQAQVVGNSGVRATQGVEFLQTPGLPQVIQPGQPLTYSTLNGLDVPVGGTFNLSNWSTSFANPGPNSVPFTVSVDKGVLTRSGPIVSVTSSIVPSSTTSTPSDPAPSFLIPSPPPTGILASNSLTSITPTSFTDSFNSVPGRIVSLRDAVYAANNSTAAGTVTINLRPGTYSLSIPPNGVEDGTTGDLIVRNSRHSLLINGGGTSGPAATLIDANALNDRILQIQTGATVALQNLILTGGVAHDDGVFGQGPARGGAILDNGQSLTLNNVWVVGNDAEAAPHGDAQGGGIYAAGGSLSIYRSLIATNRAVGGSSSSSSGGEDGGRGQGGGLYAASGAVILGVPGLPVKVLSNRAVGGSGSSGSSGGNGGDAQGGGIYLGGGSLALTVNMASAVISSNFAQAGTGASGSSGYGGNGGSAQGAGLFIAPGSVSVVVNSVGDLFTFNRATGGDGGSGSSGNAPGGSAAGAGLFVGGGSVTLTADRFENNVALGGNGADGGFAAGAAIFSSARLAMTSTVLSRNVALGGAATSAAANGLGGPGVGAGLAALSGSLDLVANVFSSNSAIGGRGADIEQGVWKGVGGNGGEGVGGGLFTLQSVASVRSTSDTFVLNSATGGRGGNGPTGGAGGRATGAGATVIGAAITMRADVAVNNSAVGGKGGQASTDGQGGSGASEIGGGFAIERTTDNGTFVFQSNVIQSNTARGGVGGGVFRNGVGGAGGNAQGGGLAFFGVATSLASNTILFNSVFGGAGGFAGTNGALGSAKDPNVFSRLGSIFF